MFTCSAIVKGDPSKFQLEQVFEKLGPADFETLLFVVEQAVLAELRQAPGSEVGDRQIAKARRELLKRMPADDADRVQSLFFGGNSYLPFTETCRTARQFYERLLTLEEPHRSTLLRALVQKSPA